MLIPQIPYDVVSLKFKKEEIRLEMISEEVFQRYNIVVQALEKAAKRDMHAEGFKDGEYKLRYEILARYGGQLWEIRAEVPFLRIETAEDLKRILAAYEDEYEKIYSREALAPSGGIEIITAAVEAIGPVSKPAILKAPDAGKNAQKAKKGSRDVYFSGSFINTPVYDWEQLGNGNEISGPAIVERFDTTLVVPPDRNIHIDEYLNIHMSP
jgi:N-methylhydantoinase A/oxoprolinase/acetone carboxylase beta subunit